MPLEWSLKAVYLILSTLASTIPHLSFLLGFWRLADSPPTFSLGSSDSLIGGISEGSALLVTSVVNQYYSKPPRVICKSGSQILQERIGRKRVLQKKCNILSWHFTRFAFIITKVKSSTEKLEIGIQVLQMKNLPYQPEKCQWKWISFSSGFLTSLLYQFYRQSVLIKK